jgi:hypothetical protein
VAKRVERFNGGALGMLPEPMGRWVRYSDYEKLENEFKRIRRGDNDRIWEMDDWIEKVEAQRDSLRSQIEAEVEHLRDAATAGEGIAHSDLAAELEEAAGLPIAARANRRTADRLQAILDSIGGEGS